MYKPNEKQLSLRELLPKELADNPLGYGFFCPMLLKSLQAVRDEFGPLQLNSPRLGIYDRGYRTELVMAKQPQSENGFPIDTSIEPKAGDYTTIKKGMSVLDTISAAAEVLGIDRTLMGAMAQIESGLNPDAKAPTSSAAGLFQFIKGTWADMMSRYGKKYKIPAGTSPYDPVAASLMGGLFILQNEMSIASTVGSRSFQATDYYMAHFLGAGGYKSFLRAMKGNEDAIAADLLPKAAAANKWVFYKSGRALTFREIFDQFTGKMLRARQVCFDRDPSWELSKAGCENEQLINLLHTQGKAVKFKPLNCTAHHLAKTIINSPTLFPHIRGVREEGDLVTIDVRNTENLYFDTIDGIREISRG